MTGQYSIKAHKPIHKCYSNTLFSLYWSEKVDRRYGELCHTRRELLKTTFTLQVKGNSDISRICSRCNSEHNEGCTRDIKSTLSYTPTNKSWHPPCSVLVWHTHHDHNDEAKQHKLGTAKSQNFQIQINHNFVVLVFLLQDSRLLLRIWFKVQTLNRGFTCTVSSTSALSLIYDTGNTDIQNKVYWVILRNKKIISKVKLCSV